jgi:hypothetical protein
MVNPPPRHPLNSDGCGLVAPSSNSNRGLFTVRRRAESGCMAGFEVDGLCETDESGRSEARLDAK